MKIVLQKEDNPSSVPGIWYDTELKLYFKGDRITAQKIEDAIKKALSEET